MRKFSKIEYTPAYKGYMLSIFRHTVSHFMVEQKKTFTNGFSGYRRRFENDKGSNCVRGKFD